MKDRSSNRHPKKGALPKSIPFQLSLGPEADIKAQFVLQYSVPLIPVPGMTLRHKILIIDNKPDVAEMLGLMCATMGHQPMTAITPEEVYSVLQKHSFDLVLVDYHLQPENGLVLISRLRQLGLMMPAIIMTDQPKIARFMQPTFLNITKVLVKPPTLAALKAALAESLI